MVSGDWENDLEPIRDAHAHVEFLTRGVDYDTRNMVNRQMKPLENDELVRIIAYKDGSISITTKDEVIGIEQFGEGPPNSVERTMKAYLDRGLSEHKGETK